MLKNILFILLFAGSSLLYAQVSHGGSPIYFDSEHNSLELKPEASLKALQYEPVLQNGPLRFAYPIFVNYSTTNSGEWIDIGGDQMLWRLSLKSNGAKSLSVVFERFHLMGDAQVFLYSADKSYFIGAFTSENNKEFGSLATSPVLGDEIVIELITNKNDAFQHQLQLGEVYHDFLGVMDYLLKADRHFGNAGNCNVDVNCDDQLPDEVKRASCKITIGGFLCSGTLVNNTLNNGKPYMLTAGHCIGDQAEAERAVVYFNFEAPECIDSIAGTDQQKISGANFRAGVTDMDFALIELAIESPIPASYRPYWAGWDRTEVFSNPVYSVHHPEGDVKKIARSEEPPIATTFHFPGFLTENHWKINKWASGTTEGGSSGSGLFSAGNQLIGSLSGGEGTCSHPRNDYYARLNNAWNYHADSARQLAYWLDPMASDVISLAGYDLYDNKVERVSQVPAGATPSLMYSNHFKGTWSGNNDRGYDGYAQYFFDYGSATIHGIYVIPAKCEQNSSSSINVKVWNSINSYPTNVVFEQNNIPLKELRRREYLIDVQSPIVINGEFFIGIELNNPTANDTIALYNVKEDIGQHVHNRAYIRSNGQWKAFNLEHPSGENGSYWIDFLGSDMDLATEVDTLLLEPVEIRPNPCRNGLIGYKTTIEHLSSIEMYDFSGRLIHVYPRNGEKEDHLLVPASVTNGMYILVFKNSLEAISKKVFIIR